MNGIFKEIIILLISIMVLVLGRMFNCIEVFQICFLVRILFEMMKDEG